MGKPGKKTVLNQGGLAPPVGGECADIAHSDQITFFYDENGRRQMRVPIRDLLNGRKVVIYDPEPRLVWADSPEGWEAKLEADRIRDMVFFKHDLKLRFAFCGAVVLSLAATSTLVWLLSLIGLA